MPVWQDITKYLETYSSYVGVRFCLTIDVSHAHRQIPVREEDWGYLACRAEEGAVQKITEEDELYVNTVGTFGVGSASYWWARLAAVAARIWFGLGADVWRNYLLMYVDDGWARHLDRTSLCSCLPWCSSSRSSGSLWPPARPARARRWIG
jgi:hypothetical protein